MCWAKLTKKFADRSRKQRWIYLRSIWGLQAWWATWGLYKAKAEDDLRERKRKLGEWVVLVNKEPRAFHWLSPCRKKRSLSFLLLGFAIFAKLELSLSVSWLFNWGFCLLFLQMGSGVSSFILPVTSHFSHICHPFILFCWILKYSQLTNLIVLAWFVPQSSATPGF